MRSQLFSRVVLCGAALMAMAAPLPSCFADWSVSPVNLSGDVGWSLFIDSAAGKPHIAYWDDGDLSYEVLNGSQWEKKATVSNGDSFALDANGTASFINSYSPNFYPMHQTHLGNGVLLGRQVTNARAADGSFLAFDKQNRAHFAFVQPGSQQLKHAVLDGSQWTIRTVATGTEFQYSSSNFSAALDANDQIHFAWQNSSDVLRYARPSGSSWALSSPFPSLEARPFDLQIDSLNNVHLAYDVWTGNTFTGGLFYGTSSGSTWSGARVAGLDSFGAGRTKISIDEENQPHLYTFDSTFNGPDQLKHLSKNGSSWTSEVLHSYTSTSSGAEEIAVTRDFSGVHVLFSTGNAELYYAFESSGLVPGDFDRNGRVGANDLQRWRESFGVNAGGDADFDGDTDGGDFLIWQRAYQPPAPQPTTPIVVNGDFANAMSSWTTTVTPNGSLTVGFPRVESFDVDGDGAASPAMRIRVGQIAFDSSVPAGAGIEQVINVPAPGTYLLSADIASTNTDITANTGPGRYELMLDGQVLDVVDFSGTTINVGQVMRGTLSVEINNLTAGAHTLRLMFVRTGTNTRHIYQYVDDISLTPLAGAQAVPEPHAMVLAVMAMLAVPRRTSRRR